MTASLKWYEEKCKKCIHLNICESDEVITGMIECDQFEEKRPRGKWGEWNEDRGYPCSNCGEYLPYSDEYDYQSDFCPNCGADMRKEGEKNE